MVRCINCKSYNTYETPASASNEFGHWQGMQCANCGHIWFDNTTDARESLRIQIDILADVIDSLRDIREKDEIEALEDLLDMLLSMQKVSIGK